MPGYLPLGIEEAGGTLGTSAEPAVNRIETMEEGAMWFALFSIACAAAVCLSVAAVDGSGAVLGGMTRQGTVDVRASSVQAAVRYQLGQERGNRAVELH